MSNQEKQHMSQRTNMQNLRYLNSFMDEIDWEVMSLTDRAFKSLCIGDEAIYNDSELSPSPVSCHKPRVEDVSKRGQERTFPAVRNLDSNPLNGVNNALCRSNKNSSKDISLFALFPVKYNGKGTKMTNGDSWDKSALLSIQRELSEFSSDYHSLTVEQISPVRNNLKSDEKAPANKSSKDALIPSGKSKHNKNNKLRKLNSKNFFLHSEFSPFLLWRDFNKYSIGQEHISEIVLSNRQSQWYDSPLYKELTAAHRHYKLHVPLPKCPTEESQGERGSTPPSVPPKPKKETECAQHDLFSESPLLAAEQRCHSEKGEPCVPWRKNKSRANSAVPLGHFISGERPKIGGGAQTTEKEVKTVQDQTSSSSTPFSISQLLTPAIPSRHGTGTSELMQAVFSPTAMEVTPLPEKEACPSPEIRREGYKSMASSLLFNLKDNRKRVKAMYSPPKFKGLDVASHSKDPSLAEASVSKDVLKIPEGDKTISPARQKAKISPMSPLIETANTQTCSPQGCANEGIPDDYLALSLLQSGGLENRPLKSNRSPLANKVAYPSLKLYRKANPEEIHIATIGQTVVDSSSQVFTDKVRLQAESKLLESVLNASTKTSTASLNTHLHVHKSRESPSASSKKPDEHIHDGTHQNKDSMQKSPVTEKESNRKDEGAKRLFSAKQNNYIKSQRFVGTDNDDDGSNADKALLTMMDKKDECCRQSRNTTTTEIRPEERNMGFSQNKEGGGNIDNIVQGGEKTATKNKSSVISHDLETQRLHNVKNGIFSMVGNTFAKRALFASMEQMPSKTNVSFSVKENTVVDKYDLAKMALEEVIAEREQRKLKSKLVLNADRNNFGCEGGQELPISEDDKQGSTFVLSERMENAKDGKGQHGVSSFKTSRQTNVAQMWSEHRVPKHGESQTKLNRRCKQEASVGQCQHAMQHITDTERDRLGDRNSKTDNTSKGDKVLEHREKDTPSVGQYEDELGIEIKGCSYKPEIPPRRGKLNPQSNGVVEATRNKEFNRKGDTVKTEEMEYRKVSKVQRSQSKNQGPVRGNVSALKDKYNKESGEHHKALQKCHTVEEMCSEKCIEAPNEEPDKDQMKHKTIIPKLTVCPPESETCSVIHMDMDSEKKRTSDKPPKVSERDETDFGSQREHDNTQGPLKSISDLTNNRHKIQDREANGTENKEEGSASLMEPADKFKGLCKRYTKDILTGISSSERVKTTGEQERELSEVTLVSCSEDSISEHANPGQSQSTSSLTGKQTHHSNLSSSEISPLHQSEQEPQSRTAGACNIKEKVHGKVKEVVPKSKMDFYTFNKHERESDVSDRVAYSKSDLDNRGWMHCLNLTQISHSDTSSKDLHKTSQPLPQRDSLNELEKGEEDLDHHSPVDMPTVPVKSPQRNQPAMHLLAPPAPQINTVREGKLSAGSVSVSEEDERRSAVSTLSEGVDSYETSGGDTMEENISSTALTDAEGERSGSVCSGHDSHGQNKPPAVPPKTEKALRRAMRLTTRRIQKAEAKSKSEHKGRSSDKSVSHKAERRRHATDKIQSNKSELMAPCGDGHSSEHNEHLLDDTPEPKTHFRRHSSHRSEDTDDSDPLKQLQHAKDHNRQTHKTADSNSDGTQKLHQKSSHSKTDNDTDRSSRRNEKHAARKLERRTQSLDRVLGAKNKNTSNSMEKHVAEFSTDKLHYFNKTLPLQQNSTEHKHAPAANTVTQSFPITQRKILQDPDSGQYFLVDMPVAVKTKTFFDPETKSYVQLPVQSPEGSVRQAPPLEVMNTPPLVLYHGFVPVPVSSLPPTQTSAVGTAGILPDVLDDAEEHTPEEDINGVR